MAGSLLSQVPLVGRLFSPSAPAAPAGQGVDIAPVEVHSVDTSPEKRPRTLKHLLRANHVNHALLFHDLQFDNHMPHHLCSAYLLGASSAQLHAVYDAEARSLEPWPESPAEIVQADWRDFLGDKRYQRAYVDFFEDKLAMRFAYDWKAVVEEYMFGGDAPLAHGLIGGCAWPPCSSLLPPRLATPTNPGQQWATRSSTSATPTR